MAFKLFYVILGTGMAFIGGSILFNAYSFYFLNEGLKLEAFSNLILAIASFYVSYLSFKKGQGSRDGGKMLDG